MRRIKRKFLFIAFIQKDLYKMEIEMQAILTIMEDKEYVVTIDSLEYVQWLRYALYKQASG